MDTLFDLISKRVPHEVKKTVSLLNVQTTVKSVLGLYPKMNRHINTAAIKAEERRDLYYMYEKRNEHTFKDYLRTLRSEKEAAQRHLDNLEVEKEKVLIFILEAQKFQNKNYIVPAEEKVKILEEYLRFQKSIQHENSYINRRKLNQLDYLLKKCKKDQTALKDILNSYSSYHNYEINFFKPASTTDEMDTKIQALFKLTEFGALIEDAYEAYHIKSKKKNEIKPINVNLPKLDEKNEEWHGKLEKYTF